MRIGISACLLGQRVRYDGGHKRQDSLVETVGRHVEWVPVCPEVELGLGTPRPTLRLEGPPGDLRLVMPSRGEDLTRRMRRWAKARVRALGREELAGFVLKKGSPSCGVARLPVYGESGRRTRRDGVGFFAAALLEAFPDLPVEEEHRLCDPALRESFFVRVFATQRLRGLFRPRWRLEELEAFHEREKLLLLAHDPAGRRSLGQLVARGTELPRAELAARYRKGFAQALARRATVAKHAKVLRRCLGYFERRLDAGERAELSACIADYRRRLVPLVVPVTRIKHCARRFALDSLLAQSYLDPQPQELMLRNHA